jgi:RecB family exonuclease
VTTALKPEMPRGRYYSVSSVDTYLECPQRYHLAYVRRLPRPPRDVPTSWKLGSAVHKGLQRAYEQARRERRGDHMAAFLPEALAGLDEAWAEEGLSRDYGDPDWAIEVLQRALDALDAPHPGEVLLVEEQMVEVNDDGVILHGYVDLAIQTGVDTVRIRDWKVTSNRKDTSGVAGSPQLALYAWLARRRWPWVRTVTVEEFYPPLGVGVSVVSDPEGAELEVVSRFEAVAEMVEEAQATGEWPTKVGEQCSNCPFKSHCPAWQPGSPTQEALHDVRKF